MNLMRHLTNLNKLNLLSPEQKLWFKSPKSNEEFYDLENDPFELNNLITDKAFSSQIEELRAQLDNWMIQINDNVDLSEKELIARLQSFGYTTETMQFMLLPLVSELRDPLGSMGNDAALACLSDKPRLLFDYFKQLYAQVTNPAIDSIREEEIMLSLIHI